MDFNFFTFNSCPTQDGSGNDMSEVPVMGSSPGDVSEEPVTATGGLENEL